MLDFFNRPLWYIYKDPVVLLFTSSTVDYSMLAVFQGFSSDGCRSFEMSKIRSGELQSTLTPVTVSEKQAYEIGLESYFYFYPLLTMELTRQQSTNVELGKIPGFGPMNIFSHMRAYPDADFRTVVRPNFDTLYSVVWLDLTQEPMIVSVPATHDRYYLLPMLDMWSDVFAVPGWRTSGTEAKHFGVVQPTWTGKLPEGVERVEAPTPYVWIIGRTKTDGPDDYAAVHKIQDGFTATPLSQWGQKAVAPAVKFDPKVDMKTPPLEQINSMSAANYFSKAAVLLRLHPSHLSDWSITERQRRIGIESGKNFEFEKLDAKVQNALQRAVTDGLKLLKRKVTAMGQPINGWQMNVDTMGVYGNFYFKRAIVSMVGLGANQPEDAIYPMNYADADGKPLDGANNYVLHFDAQELPPVSAFWSVTMYDSHGFQSANSINRFALSSWMPMKKNSDGSLDIYIQNANPGAEKEANWLPAPKELLGVTMRLYAPMPEALNGDWNPPAIKRAK